MFDVIFTNSAYMLQQSTLQFLKKLAANNNKTWFDANRKLYDSAKTDIEQFVSKLIPAIANFDEPIGRLQVKDCTFRINRDVRFSKNKDPYKSNMAAYLSPGGKKSSAGGYYFHCEPGKSFAAGGVYSPEPAMLSKIRQEIDYGFEEWKKIVNNKGFKKYFPKGVEGMEVLTRPPKGYDENNPAIDYLKMKNFIVVHPLTDADLLNKNLVKEVAKAFAAMKPMIDFLNQAME